MTRPSNEQILSAYAREGNQRAAARFLDMPQSTFNKYYKQIQEGKSPEQIYGGKKDFEMQEIPDEDIPLQDILDHKLKVYKKKKTKRDATQYVDVYMKTNDPIGISFFGDPHIDDDGCDIGKLIDDMDLCENTDGLHAINIGDVTNNWVGRLEKLSNKQSITLAQTYKLTEWFMEKPIWLAHIVGNHDHWNNGKYLLKSMMKKSNCKILEDSAKLRLNFPNGEKVTVNARHDFKGHSQWNSAHGVSKAAQMGMDDDLLVNGHTHVSGYQVVKSPKGKVSHCVQLSAYKIYDSFADEKGFRDQAIFNNVVAVIDPANDARSKVQVFFEPKQGAAYLDFLRKKNEVTNKLITKKNMGKDKGLRP